MIFGDKQRGLFLPQSGGQVTLWGQQARGPAAGSLREKQYLLSFNIKDR